MQRYAPITGAENLEYYTFGNFSPIMDHGTSGQCDVRTKLVIFCVLSLVMSKFCEYDVCLDPFQRHCPTLILLDRQADAVHPEFPPDQRSTSSSNRSKWPQSPAKRSARALRA